jgi:hypothetical protein
MKEAVALKTLADQDWKTQLAHGYPNIPDGAVVTVVNEDFVNFYGSWCEVMWNDTHYYISKQDLSFDEGEVESAKQKQQEWEQYKEKFNRK